MKRRRFLDLAGKGVVVAGAGAYLIGCEEELILKETEEAVEELVEDKPFESIITKRTIKTGLQSPTGLSKGNISALKSKSNPTSIEDVVFCEGGIVDNTGEDFLIKPKIFKYAGEPLTQQIFYEFTKDNHDINDFKTSNFDSFLYGEIIGQKSRGLMLETLVENGNVLFLSNVSNKIYQINSIKEKTIYLESDELIGITKIISADDGKKYAVQSALVTEDGELIRDKRMISIDANGIIKPEAILPRGNIVPLLTRIESGGYAGAWIENGSYMEIIENLNKEVNDSKFYISDQQSDVIYKVSDAHEVTILKQDIGFPSGLVMRADIGYVHFKTTPIVNWPPTAYPMFPIEFKSINPKTAEISSLFKYDIEDKYGSACAHQKIIIDEKEYGVVAGNFVSSILIEGEIENDFYFTDSMCGEFESLLQTLAPEP